MTWLRRAVVSCDQVAETGVWKKLYMKDRARMAWRVLSLRERSIESYSCFSIGWGMESPTQ